MQAFSLSSACIPYLKPFLESLQSGLLRADDLGTLRSGDENKIWYKAFPSSGRQDDYIEIQAGGAHPDPAKDTEMGAIEPDAGSCEVSN